MPHPPNLSDILRYKNVSARQIEQPCVRTHLIEIARGLTGWESLAPFLGLKISDEEDIRVQYPGNARKQTEAMLILWKERFGERATYRVLIEAFLKVGKASLAETTCDILTSNPQPPDTPEIKAIAPVASYPQALTYPTTAHPSPEHVQATQQSNAAATLADYQQLLPMLDESVLTEEDLGDVLDEVVDLAGRWPNMCTALRLRSHAEGTIARQYFHQVDDCLKAALHSWLRQEYDTVKYGLPTWKKLVEAVAKRAGGNDVALAKEIAEKHIKKVPDVIPTLSVDTDQHSTAYGSLQGPHPLQVPPQSAAVDLHVQSRYPSSSVAHRPQSQPQPQPRFQQSQPQQIVYQLSQPESQLPSSSSSDVSHRSKRTNRPKYAGRVPGNEAGPRDEDRKYKKMAFRQDIIIRFLATNVNPAGLADKLWISGLINEDIRDKALVVAVPVTDRIRPMIDAVITKIEVNVENFHTFIVVLRKMGGLDDLIHLIESPLKE